MSTPMVPRLISFTNTRRDGAAAAVAPLPQPAPAPPTTANRGLRWRASLLCYVEGIAQCLDLGARMVGLPVLTPAARDAVAWGALSQNDPAIREVAVLEACRAFEAVIQNPPADRRGSLRDTAVRAAIDAYETRLAEGWRIR